MKKITIIFIILPKMFQQAYNMLKKDNDDRQKIIRDIRDNYHSKFPMSTHNVRVMDERMILANEMQVEIRYDVDYCYTNIRVDYTWEYLSHRERDSYDRCIYCNLQTYRYLNNTTDMWLEHFIKTRDLLSRDCILIPIKPYEIFRHGFGYGSVHDLIGLRGTEIEVPMYIDVMFARDKYMLETKYSEDIYEKLVIKYKWYDNLYGTMMSDRLFSAKFDHYITILEQNYSDDSLDKLCKLADEYKYRGKNDNYYRSILNSKMYRFKPSKISTH